MVNINVAEWTPDEVANWLAGLQEPVGLYIPMLKERGLNGKRLLILRCDDLEYLGVKIIGHQEIILEAVEQLRNFHYETKRECVQQLALRVSVVGSSLARSLSLQQDPRLDTQSLAEVARLVRAVKPLAWWLERCGGDALAARRITLLTLALEAATCAQRDRFAEQPARAVAAAAAKAAAAADALVKQVNDPMLLTPGALDTVRLAQGERPLGFRVVRLASGRRHLADIKFGSPAHCAPALNDGDEIVQVGTQCVVGWQCRAVQARCVYVARSAAAAGQLALGVCRRPPPARSVWLPKKVTIPEPEVEAEAEGGPESEDTPLLEDPVENVAEQTVSALSDPAARMFPPKPRSLLQRRHTVCVPRFKNPRTLMQILEEIKEHRWLTGHSNLKVDIEDTLYRRDKAVSYSTGLELSPRPRTCMAMLPSSDVKRGKLDKSHSTPAYDLNPNNAESSLIDQTIPESPTTPNENLTLQSAEKTDTILDFKKSSTQIGEAILQRHRRESLNQSADDSIDSNTKEPVDAFNKVVIECVNAVIKEPPILKPKPNIPIPVLRTVPRPPDTLDYSRNPKLDTSQISLSLRQFSKEDIVVIKSEKHALPALNGDPDRNDLPRSRKSAGAELSLPSPASPDKAAHSPTSSMVRGIFPSSKTRSLKKKHSILAKRRDISYLTLWRLGAYCGGAWQRVRRGSRGGAGGNAPGGGGTPGAGVRWLHRQLALLHSVLYAFESVNSTRADCMVRLSGFTASLAFEVRSRAHAFKVYHTGRAVYFACDSHDAADAWVQLIQRASDPGTVQTDASMQFSETDYSDEGSETETQGRLTEPDRLPETKSDHKDKSKFGSLKKLTNKMQRSESHEHVASSTSLDRKYLRFFSRNKSKDDKHAKFQASRPSTTSLPPALHLSNPNLAPTSGTSGSRNEFCPSVMPQEANVVTKPVPDTSGGLLTLEQFMLKKQYEERAQSRRSLRRRAPPPRYDKYSPEKTESNRSPVSDTWRELRRNDKVHEAQRSPQSTPASSESGSASRLRLLCTREPRETAAPYRPSQLPVPSPLMSLQYSNLQYPPTFQPESYSLAHLAASRQRPQ